MRCAQAEQLWNVLIPEDDSRRNGFLYSRSYSVPIENDATKPSWGSSTRSLSPAPAAGANMIEKSSSNSNSNSGSGSSGSTSNAAREPSRIAIRSRAQSLPHGPSGVRRGHSSSCRLGVRGFLRLADLLHERVVEAGEGEGDGHGHGGRGEERACYLAGFEDDEYDDGVGAGFSPGLAHGALGLSASQGGRGGASIRESESENESDQDEEHSDEDQGEDEESASGGQCCYSGDEGARARPHARGAGNSAHAPPSSNGVASGGGRGSSGAPFSPWQRMERCASCVFGQARMMSRRAVGCEWFSTLSKAIAVCFFLLALAWTPLAQQRYDDADGDGCLEGGHGECNPPDGDEVVDYQWEDLLRRLRGAVLLAFLGEMTVKV